MNEGIDKKEEVAVVSCAVEAVEAEPVVEQVEESNETEPGVGDVGREYETAPPEYEEGSVERDIARLKAIAEHPKAAAFLDELAQGGDEQELVRKYFPRAPAMYQSVDDGAMRSMPAFLSNVRKGFWES